MTKQAMIAAILTQLMASRFVMKRWDKRLDEILIKAEKYGGNNGQD